MKRTIQKGFTLIELLIVIAVLGVLSAGVVVAINPVKRMNSANDAKVKNDVGQIANAAQAYFTDWQCYPSGGQADLVTAGDLTVALSAPSTYAAYTVVASPGSCSCTATVKTCTGIAIGGQIKAPVTAGNTKWCWTSTSGTAVEGTTCP